MHPLEEKDSSPLADTEITRLIKVSRELGYKKQDKIPERNLEDFKPTSIFQIADSSDDKKQNIHKSEPIQKSEPEHDKEMGESEKEPDNIDSRNKANPNYNYKEASEKDSQQEMQVETPSKRPTQSDTDQLSETDQENKLDAEVKGEFQESETTHSGSLTDEKAISEPTHNILQKSSTISVEEAKQEGIQIGKNIASTEFENEKQKMLETFQQVIDNIRKKEILDKTELTQSILDVVTRLASERVGEALDNNSEPFKNKIISFVEKIEKASKKLTLKLNSKDANLLKKNLRGSLNDEEIEIKETSELFRGDFILQMGSVEIGDLISEQISINEKAIETEELQVDAHKDTSLETPSENVISTAENKDTHEKVGHENEK